MIYIAIIGIIIISIQLGCIMKDLSDISSKMIFYEHHLKGIHQFTHDSNLNGISRKDIEDISMELCKIELKISSLDGKKIREQLDGIKKELKGVESQADAIRVHLKS